MQQRDDPDACASARSSFRATVFRQDGSIASVTVSDFGFDGCSLSAEETFVPGERLKLYECVGKPTWCRVGQLQGPHPFNGWVAADALDGAVSTQ